LGELGKEPALDSASPARSETDRLSAQGSSPPGTWPSSAEGRKLKENAKGTPDTVKEAILDGAERTDSKPSRRAHALKKN